MRGGRARDRGHADAARAQRQEILTALATGIEFLRRPGSYPDGTLAVEAVETRLSWVFLTRLHAYKLKKALVDEHVDLRTVEARRRNCLEELAVNRRFSPDVYQDAVPLVRAADGSLRLGGAGAPIDWLVRTRRLPAERMLDAVIARGELRQDDIARVVDLLCRVYAASSVPAAGYRERLLADTATCERVLAQPELDLPAAAVVEACERQREFLSRPGALADRAAHVVEGHGDLRPEHVALTDPPQIIDALEFSRTLRTLDAADELGFLALECERLGAAHVRTWIFDAYARATRDRPAGALIHCYQSHRACVRAMLAVRHLVEHPGTSERERWLGRARRYVELALAHARTVA